jgi:hypothetical protein
MDLDSTWMTVPQSVAQAFPDDSKDRLFQALAEILNTYLNIENNTGISRPALS